MTLSLKIKHTGPEVYTAEIKRNGTTLATLKVPGDEATVLLWDGAPLEVIEHPAEAKAEAPAAPQS